MLNHNTTTKRFPRTSQPEPWRGVITHYRGGNGPAWRLLRLALYVCAMAAIGVLMAWRG